MRGTLADIEPIVVTVDLPLTPADAYGRFVDEFAAWWPVLTHSLSRDPAARCRLEPVVHGRLYETAPDGSEHGWGQVEQAEPGSRICFTWHPGREPESAQRVTVSFAPTSRGCRVTLAHDGWAALGEIAPLLRAQYLPGWQQVLGEHYARHAQRPR
jgi:uncharacterized protein YndB with AHSA1/START domain